ncbi:hypothetical protein [Pacificoceanicola onchidii]|uniref:hypothetical protein n=1 Tax=Pacificoceanicola onchidii TaxID=2562685 RepID=UPI0010A365E8|nr:hypothetical protein [Pacificoceanicola onchidii]
MSPFYISLHLYDPLGPLQLAEGGQYGGAAQLFVVEAEGLAEALLDVVEAIADQSCRLLRIGHAGPLSEYLDEHFPFPADVGAMAQDARAGMVSTPAYSFEPWGAEVASGVSIAVLDVYDPSMEGGEPYAGELTLAACPGTPEEALRVLLEVLDGSGVRLKRLEDLRESAEASADEYDDDWPLLEIVAEAGQSGAPSFSPAFVYEAD